MKELKPNKNYKVKVTYGNKTTKTMTLTGQQIIDRRNLNARNKSKHKPYITITVIEPAKNVIATVRVLPFNEDDEIQEERAMEYEYKDSDYDYFDNILTRNPSVKRWEVTGNAYSIEAPKNIISKFAEIVKSRNPGVNIGVEWNYWVG